MEGTLVLRDTMVAQPSGLIDGVCGYGLCNTLADPVDEVRYYPIHEDERL